MPKASGQVPLGFGHFFSVLGQRLQPSRFFAAGRGRSCQGLASSSGRGFPASRPQKCFALIGRGVFGSGGQGLLFRLGESELKILGIQRFHRKYDTANFRLPSHCCKYQSA
jgi:hypothetical protein